MNNRCLAGLPGCNCGNPIKPPTLKGYTAAINRAVENMTRATRTPTFTIDVDPPARFGPLFRMLESSAMTVDKPAPARRGDKVELKVTAYVRHVNADGTVELAETREPYADPLTLDYCHPSRLTVRERYVEPNVKPGAVIDGRTVRETPWRRGTVLRDVTEDGDEDTFGELFVLMPDGKWTNVHRGNAGIPFTEFRDGETFVVELAPGK